MKSKIISFDQFRNQFGKKEGLVCLGCGGKESEWINGLTKTLNEADIAKGTSNKLWEGIYRLTSTGGRIDLAFVFKNNGKGFNIGKMAMWRLRFGSCSWISDYLVNYASHF